MKYIIAVMLMAPSYSGLTCTTFLLSRHDHFVFELPVNHLLKPFTPVENATMIKEGADGSRKNFVLRDEIVKHLAEYAQLVKCK